jgi:hypothetical protein
VRNPSNSDGIEDEEVVAFVLIFDVGSFVEREVVVVVVVVVVV